MSSGEVLRTTLLANPSDKDGNRPVLVFKGDPGLKIVLLPGKMLGVHNQRSGELVLHHQMTPEEKEQLAEDVKAALKVEG